MTPRWVIRRAPSGEWWWVISPVDLYFGFNTHLDAIRFVDRQTRLAR